MGRLESRTHPSTIVETMHYNNYGYMEFILAGGLTRFTITGRNAREQLTGATYGSSLAASFGFDAYGYPSSTATGSIQDYRYAFNPVTGNASSRQNFKRNLSESFGYNNLDRLTSVTGPQNLSMTYNANGNIKTKSDIGSTVDFGYGTNAGPYALTGVSSSTGVIPATDQAATYTSFEKVSTLSEGVYSASFIYNSENQRAKMDVAQSGSAILTRWYAGSSYMKETASGVTKEYTYIGGDAYTAPVAAITQSGATTWYYLLRDHLGNITHQVNTANTVVAEYSFDAWGRRRSADDWSYTLDANDLALFADRGFTGHETLPWFNLVNMNGRLYDPLVGRFLSPDPVIQNPDLTQNYNRYSYCLNNPLKYTDPSGYWRKGGVADWWNSGAYRYSQYKHLDGRGGSYGGGGATGIGSPGSGGNGTGLNGTYYDWRSGSYRSTNTANSEVGWGYAHTAAARSGNDLSSIVYSGTAANPYQTVLGWHYTDGTSYYYRNGPLGGGGHSALDYAGLLAGGADTYFGIRG